MYLANKNIDFIRNFDRFCNLEVLWLNGNKVRLSVLSTTKTLLFPSCDKRVLIALFPSSMFSCSRSSGLKTSMEISA